LADGEAGDKLARKVYALRLLGSQAGWKPVPERNNRLLERSETSASAFGTMTVANEGLEKMKIDARGRFSFEAN
jgi:hypothetical protein